MSNRNCMIQHTLINLYPNEHSQKLHYYSFALSLGRCIWKLSHPATRRRSDAVVTSLCASQRRRRSVLNETPNDVMMEHHQHVSVVYLHDVLLERHDDV